MVSATVEHLVHNVLDAAGEYSAAEQELTAAHRADSSPTFWEAAARKAKRRAAELAIAIDGLTDRGEQEFRISKTRIRDGVSALCLWPDSGTPRLGAHDRIRGVANAYKHQTLSNTSLPIASEADVLVVGLGFGLDGYGVGKFNGVEVLIRERDSMMYKFLGDAPVSIAAWFKFLAARGVALPIGPYQVCGLQVHP